jgi:peptidyl-prolyl isomerase E (cyclophilin E)
MAEGGRAKRTIYVGGLDSEVTQEMLYALCVPFGDIASVEIPKEWKQGGNRGFGFVEYTEAGDAQAALDNLDGAELMGRVIRVNLARPQKHKLGSTKAVWTADDWLKEMAERTAHDDGDDVPPAESLDVVVPGS